MTLLCPNRRAGQEAVSHTSGRGRSLLIDRIPGAGGGGQGGPDGAEAFGPSSCADAAAISGQGEAVWLGCARARRSL